MSVLLYFSMILFGFVGTIREVLNKRKSTICLIGLLFFYIATLCSRIGHGYDYSDITHYVNYFIDDNDTYFEPGYVFFTDSIKHYFGYIPTIYIALVGIWIIFFIVGSNKICFKYSQNKDIEKDDIDNSSTPLNYACSFFFLFSLYWGASFGCEVIRLGMAICMQLFAMAYALNKKYLIAFLLVIGAFFFQYTSAAFLIGLFCIIFVKPLPKRIYVYWLIFMLLCDFLIATGVLNSFIGSSLLSYVLNFSDIFSHYDAYDSSGGGGNGWISLQYFAYYLFGIYMLAGNLENPKYNKSVMIYFIGLFMGVLLRGTVYVMRIQWVFFPSIIFALYYYIAEGSGDSRKKLYILSLYSTIQIVMALRYLGALHI